MEKIKTVTDAEIRRMSYHARTFSDADMLALLADRERTLRLLCDALPHLPEHPHASGVGCYEACEVAAELRNTLKEASHGKD